MNDGLRSAVKLLREKGMGIKQIARDLQIGVGTVYSVMSVKINVCFRPRNR